MDCNSAQPHVSALYDGEEIPQEAVRHIMECDYCHARLQDYAGFTSGMRLLAAEEETAKKSTPRIGQLPASHSWFFALGKSIRVPRLAIAAFLVVLAFVTLGWLRTAAQGKLVTRFWCEIKTPGGGWGGSRLQAGEPDTETAFSGDDGYAWKIEPLKIDDNEVRLRIRIKHFTKYVDFDTARQEVEKVAPQEISYIPGQEISIPIDNGGHALLRGTVLHETEFPQEQPQPAAALLPGPDEINIQTPVLIRDGKELLAVTSSGTRFRCEGPCGFSLYIPGEGRFLFSPKQLDDGVQGTAFMGQIIFQEDQHFYSLLAGTPIFGGEQPRQVWIAHDKDYLPSKYGLGKSADDLVSLGGGGYTPRPDSSK